MSVLIFLIPPWDLLVLETDVMTLILVSANFTLLFIHSTNQQLAITASQCQAR